MTEDITGLPPLLQPKTITLTNGWGDTRTFVISKIPAIQAREIITQYPLTMLPRVGDYKANEGLMFKLLGYAAIMVGEGDKATPMRLVTPTVINAQMPDWEMQGMLEMAMVEYNCSFFQNGRVSGFSKLIAQKAPAFVTQIATLLQRQSSQKS